MSVFGPFLWPVAGLWRALGGGMMRLAHVSISGRGATDAELSALVRRLAGQGVRLAGCVRAEVPGLHLRLLPAGPVLDIGQNLGPAAQGCRLDTGALEDVVARVAQGLGHGLGQRLDLPAEQAAQLVIINKFGRHEADGRGFRPLIAEALALELPVLVGVPGEFLPAFAEFAGEIAGPPLRTAAALDAWVAALGA